jgi:zinc transport system substrate-binding protein
MHQFDAVGSRCIGIPAEPWARDRSTKQSGAIGTSRPTGWLLLLLALILAGCGENEQSDATISGKDKPLVIASTYPLHYFVQRLAGDTVDAQFPVPPNADPAYWKPSPTDIATMQQADLILLNGVGFEHWLSTVTLPDSKLVDTSTSFQDRTIYETNAVTHQHGPEGEHSHGDTAYTVWMDMTLAIEQTAAIHQALARLMPKQTSVLQNNFTALTNDLAALDRGFADWAQTLGNQPLLGSHPVYQYFARRYALNLKSLHWEPDEHPSEAAWSKLQELLKSHPAKWIMWEGDPMDKTTKQLGQMQIQSVVIAPCGNRPDQGDFLSAMKDNLAQAKTITRISPQE